MFALGVVDGDVECGILNGSPNFLLVPPRGECDRDAVVVDMSE